VVGSGLFLGSGLFRFRICHHAGIFSNPGREQGPSVAMSEPVFKVLDGFPEPAHADLAKRAFSDDEPSAMLAGVLEAERAARVVAPPPEADALRIGAFVGGGLVGWTYARGDGVHLLSINSGVSPDHRRRGIYTGLVDRVLAHARERGYVSVQSRHAAGNNAVIIPKLKLGFFVSGFEYSEVYGPLVRLTYLVSEPRRELHRVRARPISPAP